MDCWNNNNIMEFIELLQSEPCIWDPKKKSHKNRMAVNDAWDRIKNTFSLLSSVEELKKKRNSLMASYRDHLKKMKDSYITGSSTDDVYQPTWFAFEAMHSFLGPVYEYHNTINTEEQTTPNSERPLSRNSDMGMGSGSESPQNERCSKRKNTTRTIELLQVKKQMDEAFSLVKERNVQKQADENDLFGQLVAQKLKKMNEDDRIMLTHDIHNLIFKYEIKARSSINEQSSSSHTSTLINTPSDFKTASKPLYTVHIPESSTTQYESVPLQPRNYNINIETPKSHMSTLSTQNLIKLKSNPLQAGTLKKNIKIISQVIAPPPRQLNNILTEAYNMSGVSYDSN